MKKGNVCDEECRKCFSDIIKLLMRNRNENKRKRKKLNEK